MKLALSLAAIALVAAAPADAREPTGEGWSQIDDDPTETYFIRDKDWTAGRPESTAALVWTWVHKKRDRNVSHNMLLLEINCPAEAYRVVQGQQFDHAGKSSDIGSSEWQFAAPQTIVGEIVRVTCMEPEQPAASWDA